MNEGRNVRLEDKRAIVMGAASGIGKAIVLAFAAEGAAVVVDYKGDLEKAEGVVQQIRDRKHLLHRRGHDPASGEPVKLMGGSYGYDPGTVVVRVAGPE